MQKKAAQNNVAGVLCYAYHLANPLCQPFVFVVADVVVTVVVVAAVLRLLLFSLSAKMLPTNLCGFWFLPPHFFLCLFPFICVFFVVFLGGVCCFYIVVVLAFSRRACYCFGQAFVVLTIAAKNARA